MTKRSTLDKQLDWFYTLNNMEGNLEKYSTAGNFVGSTAGNFVGSTERAKNLLVVVAVEEYSRRHRKPARETLELFLKFDITNAIRQCYETLHTQDIYECADFAEDILKRKNI